MNQFAIDYMIKPTLHVNKLFREQVEKLLRATFHPNAMENIRYVMRQKDTYVIALIIFFERKTKTQSKCIGC